MRCLLSCQYADIARGSTRPGVGGALHPRETSAPNTPPSIVLGHTSDTYPPAYRAWRVRRLADPSLRCEDGESLTDLHTRARRCAAFLPISP